MTVPAGGDQSRSPVPTGQRSVMRLTCAVHEHELLLQPRVHRTAPDPPRVGTAEPPGQTWLCGGHRPRTARRQDTVAGNFHAYPQNATHTRPEHVTRVKPAPILTPPRDLRRTS